MQENMTSVLAFILLLLNISLLNGKRLSSHSSCLECLGVEGGGGGSEEAVSICCSAVMRNENVRVICCY